MRGPPAAWPAWSLVGARRILGSTRRMSDRLAVTCSHWPTPIRCRSRRDHTTSTKPRHLAVRRLVAVTPGGCRARDADQILRPVQEALGVPVALLGRDRTVLAGDAGTRRLSR
ncbi:hypothetical protein HBB16_06490 [Pseudonocardia sp. MCCB 268]|nr:hypothetical protein [Pseudonocardia cytotoxica]